MNPHHQRWCNSYIAEKQLTAIVTDLVAMGIEASATTLRWALLLMAKYPDIQANLQVKTCYDCNVYSCQKYHKPRFFWMRVWWQDWIQCLERPRHVHTCRGRSRNQNIHIARSCAFKSLKKTVTVRTWSLLCYAVICTKLAKTKCKMVFKTIFKHSEGGRHCHNP